MNTAQTTKPSDVAGEVAFFADGGFPAYWDTSFQFSWTTLEVELADRLMFATCGWQPGEQVNVTLYYPDGTSESTFVTADESRMAAYSRQLMLDDPEGII